MRQPRHLFASPQILQSSKVDPNRQLLEAFWLNPPQQIGRNITQTFWNIGALPPGSTKNGGLGQMQLKAIQLCGGRAPEGRADQFGAVLPRGKLGRDQGLEGKGDIELR